MSDGTKRNSDTLNTIGIVVVGICGAALVYISIVLLQAFYMDDTSVVQTMADYGGQDVEYQRGRSAELTHITQCSNVMGSPGNNTANKHAVRIEDAMRLVVEDARKDPTMLVPESGRADRPTIQAKFGRPTPLSAPAPDAPAAAPLAPAAPTAPAAAPPASGK
jgi:hypothetical protein